MEAISSSVTLVTIYKITRNHNPIYQNKLRFKCTFPKNDSLMPCLIQTWGDQLPLLACDHFPSISALTFSRAGCTSYKLSNTELLMQENKRSWALWTAFTANNVRVRRVTVVLLVPLLMLTRPNVTSLSKYRWGNVQKCVGILTSALSLQGHLARR
jgi:hypothetical protein